MKFRVFIHESNMEFASYSLAASYVQECVSNLQLIGEPSSRWWAQISRLSDDAFRLVWFDTGGVYHCSPWLSD